jgi:hypothetical protein
MRLACGVSLVLLTANVAAAQSFDCSKASTKTEKMVCADAEIAKLDTQMALQYKLLLSKETVNRTAPALFNGWRSAMFNVNGRRSIRRAGASTRCSYSDAGGLSRTGGSRN